MSTTRRHAHRTAPALPAYAVDLELETGLRHYRLEAPDLDDLADTIEREVRAARPNQHVGVRLDPNGTVMVRIGWTPSEPMGTWKPAAA